MFSLIEGMRPIMILCSTEAHSGYQKTISLDLNDADSAKVEYLDKSDLLNWTSAWENDHLWHHCIS